MQTIPPPNPYDGPESSINQPPQGPVASVSVTAGNSVTWVSDAWALFRSSPGMMIALWLILLIIITAANMIPLVGPLITPALMAGFMIGVAQLDQGRELKLEVLFDGFKHHAGPLLVLGLTFILTIFVMVIICGLLVALALNAMESGSGVGLLLGSLLLLVLAICAFLIVVFAMWWAPCLVVFNQQTPGQAMKNAIQAIFRNMLPGLVYSLILLLLYLVVIATLGLGAFVVGPLVIVSAYTSYKDIFRPV